MKYLILIFSLVGCTALDNHIQQQEKESFINSKKRCKKLGATYVQEVVGSYTCIWSLKNESN